jgi:anti-sigma B factor antagonist
LAPDEEGRSFGLSWAVHRHHGLVTVTLSGELDLASSTELESVLIEMIGADGVVVLDCEGLAFMDSTGLRLLGRLHQAAQAADHRFLLGRVSAPVRRVLHVAGLVDYFQYVEGAPPPEKLCQKCQRWVSSDSEKCIHCGTAFDR